MEPNTATAATIAPKTLETWQRHRRLTRKVIEVFPEDKLFTHSIGGVRPFSALILETHPNRLGYLRKEASMPKTKEALLQYWDEMTDLISITWPFLVRGRFQTIDNEVHRRELGSIYLRALGIEPPSIDSLPSIIN